MRPEVPPSLMLGSFPEACSRQAVGPPVGPSHAGLSRSLVVIAQGRLIQGNAPDRVSLGGTLSAFTCRSHRRENAHVMTEAERDLLSAIGARVAGPRHMTNLSADRDTLELLDGLLAQGLVVDYVMRNPGLVVRVCLTGRGWVRYREQRRP